MYWKVQKLTEVECSASRWTHWKRGTEESCQQWEL